MSDVYVFIYKQASTQDWGVLGDTTPTNFLKLDALRLLLGPFLNKSNAVVATTYFIQFWLSYMHLLSQLTSYFYKIKY